MVSVVSSAKWTGTNSPKKDVEILGMGLKSNAKEADVQFTALVLPTEDAFTVFESTNVKCRARSLLVNSESAQAQVRIRTDGNLWTAWADIT